MFESAKLKVERANHHIADIERQFAVFVKENPHRLSLRTNPQNGALDFRIRTGKDIPDSLALAVGDAVHNIRTALDHMTWEIVGEDGGTQDRYLKLPTGDNRTNFEAACQGLKTPRQEIKDMFKALEVFPGGVGSEMYSINLLDNADKHTVLRPVLRATTISHFKILNPDGTVMADVRDTTLIGGNGEYMGLASVAGGASIELGNDAQATPDIFFEKVEGPFAHRVIPTLRHYSQAALETLSAVEQRCAAIWRS